MYTVIKNNPKLSKAIIAFYQLTLANAFNFKKSAKFGAPVRIHWKLKDNKTTRQITRKAKWDNKCKVVRDQITNKLRYMTYFDLTQNNYRCATGKIWITGGVE